MLVIWNEKLTTQKFQIQQMSRFLKMSDVSDSIIQNCTEYGMEFFGIYLGISCKFLYGMQYCITLYEHIEQETLQIGMSFIISRVDNIQELFWKRDTELKLLKNANCDYYNGQKAS